MAARDKVKSAVVGADQDESLTSEEEKKIESEVLREIEPKLLARVFQMESYRGPIPPQILEKIDSAHITTTLEIAKEDSEREFVLARRQQLLNGFCVIGGFALFVFLVIFLGKNDPDLFKYILQIIVIFGGGLGLGKGFLSKRQ